MKKQIIAAIAASVLFCAGFALGTGVDANPMQAIPACIMMAASAALFRYAERSTSTSTSTGTSTGTTAHRKHSTNYPKRKVA